MHSHVTHQTALWWAGPAVGGRPARRRSKPAAFWLPPGAAAPIEAPNYREVSASLSPFEGTETAEEAAADSAVSGDPAPGGDAGASAAAMAPEPTGVAAAQEEAAVDGARPAQKQPAVSSVPEVSTCPERGF